MGEAALLAVLLALGPAHSRSEGKSVFTLTKDGRVAVQIVLAKVDIPDLCDADLSLRDIAAEERKLTRCLARDIPLLLRLRGESSPCAVRYDRFDVNAGRVVISAHAECGQLPRTLTVDWGLFAASPLDHVSTARFEQPWDKPKLALLSKRVSRITFDVAPHPAVRLAFAAAALSACAAIAAIVFRARARIRR